MYYIITILGMKNILQILKEKFIEYANHFISEYDYIFYISPEGVPIEDNNVRTIDPVYRQEIDDMINIYINKFRYKIKQFGTLSGSIEDRINIVKQTISL